MSIKRILLILFISCTMCAAAQDTNYVRQVIRKLTSEEFHGRGYSYRGDSIAAKYLRSELMRLGVEPLGDNYYQNYNFSVCSMEGPLTLSINGSPLLKPFTDYRVPAWSKSLWGDYKVLAIPIETLYNADRLKKFLKKNNDLLQDVFIYINAADYKCKNEEESRKLNERLTELKLRNPFNSLGIIIRVNELSTYSPAYTNHEHNYAYIEVLSTAAPAKIKTINCSIFTQFHSRYLTQNVCGYVPGEVDTMIVFTAHYDHLGTMGDAVTFYGAHDNASGVAAVMDLARMAVAEKPHYTHVFCFFSGEEAGLYGSKYAAEHPLFDFTKVRLLINIDMFCGGDEGIMVFNAKDKKTEPFVKRLNTLNDALHIAPEIRCRENRANSDHYYFTRHVPAIFVLSMGQRFGGYHDPMDSCDRCGLENYLNYITLISALAL